jgi:hypothetical protein
VVVNIKTFVLKVQTLSLKTQGQSSWSDKTGTEMTVNENSASITLREVPVSIENNLNVWISR